MNKSMVFKGVLIINEIHSIPAYGYTEEEVIDLCKNYLTAKRISARELIIYGPADWYGNREYVSTVKF